MKAKILVVDDDASVRESLRKVLEDVGYQVALAANGEEAVNQIGRERFDLLLLDIGLPVRNGWDTFESITSKAPVVPIIVLTGQANPHDLAVAAGVGALMEKPLDVTALLQTIEKLLAEPIEARLERLCSEVQPLRPLSPPAPRLRCGR